MLLLVGLGMNLHDASQLARGKGSVHGQMTVPVAWGAVGARPRNWPRTEELVHSDWTELDLSKVPHLPKAVRMTPVIGPLPSASAPVAASVDIAMAIKSPC